jgi:hypothetical protein
MNGVSLKKTHIKVGWDHGQSLQEGRIQQHLKMCDDEVQKGSENKECQQLPQ